MTLWMMRCGSHGEFEGKFLADQRVFLTWERLPGNLAELDTKEQVRGVLEEVYPESPRGKISNHTGQIWSFLRRMEPGDWVVVPSRRKPAVHIGEITGECQYDPSADELFRHSRSVKWIAQDVPRSNFPKDILSSFGVLMTICRIAQNDAEARVRSMAVQGWKPAAGMAVAGRCHAEEVDESEAEPEFDLEELIRDQIARHIIAQHKGHGMARLVDAILRAHGYATHLSPPGPDKGVDILAGRGDLGFDSPRLCVQVKSGDSPLDRPTLDQLIGTMQNFQAQHGLLVSWGGFRSSVDKEEASQFFRVRLWDRDDLIDQLLDCYDRLDAEVRAELPLKKVWMLSKADLGDGTGSGEE